MLSETSRPDNSRKSRFMAKKMMIYLTIFSFLNLVGCYYQQQMNPSEYSFAEQENIEVVTKDTTYSLSAADYYYDKDTLYATASASKWMYKDDYWRRYNSATKIPVKDIEKLEIEKIDAAGTTWIVVGVVIIVAGVIVNFAMGDYGIDF
jgi:hypothetical protein